MKHTLTLLAAASLALAGASAHADTPEDAKALLETAVSQAKSKGFEATVKDINTGGKWNKGKLYVVVAQFDGTMLAHSANEKIPGKNMLEAKDASGKAFVKEAIAAVKSTGNAEIPMRWADPTTKQIADATMFVRRIPGQEAYAGTVVFK